MAAQVSDRILLLSTEAEERQFIGTILRNNQVDFLAVQDLTEATQTLQTSPFGLIIASLHLIDGSSLNDAFKTNTKTPVILIGKAENLDAVPKTIKDIAFALLKTPMSAHLLISHTRKALDFGREQMRMDVANEERIVSKLEWLLWKERQKAKHKAEVEKSLLTNLRHSLGQGLGLGSLVSLIELVGMHVKSGEENVTLSRDLLQLVLESGDSMRRWLDSLENVSTLLKKEYPRAKLGERDINTTIRESIERVEGFRKIKDHAVIADPVIVVTNVFGNLDALGLAFRELLVNAFKYSPPESTVHITSFRSHNSLSLLVLNDIQQMGSGSSGIPENQTERVFDPFVRLANTFDERFIGEEIGLGLGLTILQSTMLQVGAYLVIYEITDHSEGARRRVAAEIILPGALDFDGAGNEVFRSMSGRVISRVIADQ